MIGVGLGRVLALHGQLRQPFCELGLLFFADIEWYGVVHREVGPSAPLSVDVCEMLHDCSASG
ncbi:hypothetical protein [Gordonia soli]|uniref:hypothetical protein n=1 Tax=Gordonia soli TaxID=320799 RepID=UPI00058E4FC9|nr:hypothetical protein [Gordonia soli]